MNLAKPPSDGLDQSASEGSSIRERAIGLVASYFESGRFQNELAELVTYKTESQKAERIDELDRYLREAIQPRLEQIGFTCQCHDNPVPGAGPILIAERIEAPDLPTILTYGHGDVVRGQADAWREGLRPFELIEDDDRLYGRGSADSKAQHLINIAALENVLQTRGRLGFNVKFLLETSEELGSPGLATFVKKHKEHLAADVLIASDGPRQRPDRPTMFMGARGAINFELSVNLRDGSHHSGNWGGLLADPAMILSHALASICDVRGQIKVPEWRPDSLTDDIRSVLRDLPVSEGSSPKVDEDWGEESLSPAERAYGWNSFTILAMINGSPDAPVGAISPSSKAFCQLRYVVGTDPEDILPALRRHLDRNGFHAVNTSLAGHAPTPATRMELDHPWVRFVQNSLTVTTGRSPHILPNLAGGLPNDVFVGILDVPTIWIPHSYLGCSQHAPNEHVLKSVCSNALAVMAGLFYDIGDGKVPATGQMKSDHGQ